MIVHFQIVYFTACCVAILLASICFLLLRQHPSQFQIIKSTSSVDHWYGGIRVCVLGGMVFALLSTGRAFAIELPPPDDPIATENSLQDSTDKEPIKNPPNFVSTKGGFRKGVSRTSYLLGDMWGLRKSLNKYGMSLNILETSEALGNAAGGVKRGFAYDGLTQMILQLDTQRAFHLYGGTFNVSGLQLHGRNLSSDALYSLQTASGIESNRATRLWELWYDQKFGQRGKFEVKIGQQSLDQEFMVSQNALLFVNTMFGWPMVPSADLPGGGPAYPLSAPGIRARVRPSSAWTLMAGVFNGSPALNNDGDAQESNSSGTKFPLHGGALMIAEAQFVYPSLGSMVYADKKAALSRVYKFGAWYDTETFADQRLDNSGLSLANPVSTGEPRTHHGDYALYAVADQMIWNDVKDENRSFNLFVRAMGTPQTDRNLIDFSLNAGITFNEPIRHRDDDTFGVGMGYAHVSGGATALDRDYGRFTGLSYPIRSWETFVETTYSYQVSPWCQWQPTFQYVFNPGAGITNPNSSSGQRLKNEPVFGVRMNFSF